MQIHQQYPRLPTKNNYNMSWENL